jgi:hypothetical protein
MRLSAMCKELESLGRAGSLEGASDRITSIDAEFARVKEALGGCLAGARP